MSRMEVDDYEKWGNLVKSWAREPEAAPQSLDELRRACDAVKLTISLPPEVMRLEVVTYKPDTMVLKLPPAALVEQAEAELSAPAAEYTYLPSFYADAFRRTLQRSTTRGEAPRLPTKPTLATKEERLKFHAERIGDYTIAHCQ